LTVRWLESEWTQQSLDYLVSQDLPLQTFALKAM
jgi:hypothetical protein